MESAVTALLVTATVLGSMFLLVNHFAPRCPECGSLSTTSLWMGLPIWICQRCQAVWRVR